MTLPYALLKLELPITASNPTYLRGFIGNRFGENNITHNHQKDGTNIYRYPLIQYKKIEQNFVLIGLLKQGQDEIKKFFIKLDELNIKDQQLEVLSKSIDIKTHAFDIKQEPCFSYSFISPYVALNQKNRDLYYKKSLKEEFVSKILRNHILSFLKGVGFFMPQELKISFTLQKEQEIMIKNIPFLTLFGKFKSNLLLPPFIGLGKFVSRGFGSINKAF